MLVPASQGMEVNTSVNPLSRRVTIFKNKLCNMGVTGGVHDAGEVVEAVHSCEEGKR